MPKANVAALGYEPALVQTLSELVPDRVAAPLAVDAARGWMLNADKGPTLESAAATVEVWIEIVEAVADMQLTLAGHRAELLATGMPDVTPERIEPILDRLIGWLADLPAEHPSHLDAPTQARIEAGRPRLRAAAERLAGSGIGTSMNHADVQPDNVFARPGPSGRRLLFDFGNAMWTHPFEVLAIPLRIIMTDAGFDAAAVHRVRAAYLAIWRAAGATGAADSAADSDLGALLADAVWASAVARAFSWWGAISTDLTAHESADWADAPLQWLLEIAAPAQP